MDLSPLSASITARRSIIKSSHVELTKMLSIGGFLGMRHLLSKRHGHVSRAVDVTTSLLKARLRWSFILLASEHNFFRRMSTTLPKHPSHILDRELHRCSLSEVQAGC